MCRDTCQDDKQKKIMSRRGIEVSLALLDLGSTSSLVPIGVVSVGRNSATPPSCPRRLGLQPKWETGVNVEWFRR